MMIRAVNHFGLFHEQELFEEIVTTAVGLDLT